MTQMVGQYEIRELLGEGGIGQVHAAFDTILQREVAMKSLRPELLSDANFVERFRSEATSLARLNHPNITTLYSLFPDGRNLYMVMELVRGSTLDSILEKRKVALDIRECLAIIAQAADGLDYAHSMGVIHRDIKPSNLIVSENGTLKIMDFGIARVRGSQRLTRSGSIVGTLAYMAPEQLRGEEGDDSCDLYSLAIVLYEMLSGSPPFNATSEYDLMQAQINQKPDRLTPKVAGLDPKIENALLKALSKKPDQRFPSTRAFSDALGASTLRMDAPKILHNDTRLIQAPVMPAQPVPAPRGGGLVAALPSFGFMSNMSSDLRAAIYGGGAALVVALGIVAFLLLPSSKAPPPVAARQPAPAVALQTPATAVAVAPQPAQQAPAPTVAAPVDPTPQLDPATLPAPLADIVTASNRGDPAAQNQLGVKYAQGEDPIPRNDIKAVELYRLAANQGFPKAQTNLGDMYFYGRGGLIQNYSDAASWYLKASQQDWPDAQYRLGYMYENGVGTDKDVQRAVQLYRSAADHGYAEAQNLLGILYATGSDGLTEDDKQALDWYQKASDQGFAKAEKNLGDMYFFGHGVGKDYKQAMTWYGKAADQGFADAQFRLGFMYEKGLGTQQSTQDAMAQYKKAASNGSVDAQRALDRLASKQ
jgi:TPR repeat protein/tRNA A-37 threonylcarbamoyl transferase component Bud32